MEDIDLSNALMQAEMDRQARWRDARASTREVAKLVQIATYENEWSKSRTAKFLGVSRERIYQLLKVR